MQYGGTTLYVEKDYFLRLIHEIIRALFKLLFSKDIDEEKDICLSSENEEIYNSFIHMIDNGEINLAENSLIHCLKLNDKQHFQLSLLFYEYLNSKEDSFLKEHDFSRNEILDGLKYIASIYGYSDFIQILTEETD